MGHRLTLYKLVSQCLTEINNKTLCKRWKRLFYLKKMAIEMSVCGYTHEQLNVLSFRISFYHPLIAFWLF